MSGQAYQSIYDCLDCHSRSHPCLPAEKQEPQDLSFTEIDFFPQSFGSSQPEEPPKPQSVLRAEEEIVRPARKKQSASNNTADYIIKHCLRTVLSLRQESFVRQLCQEAQVPYEVFLAFWREKLGQLKGRHLGINRFEKMLASQEASTLVLRQFLTVYLQEEYVAYLAKSAVVSKRAYL